jgi:hypothetical protein
VLKVKKMKTNSLIIMIIGAVVIGMSTMAATAEEINRVNEVPTEDISIEEQNSEEPILIAPSTDNEPLVDEVSNDEEIIPLVDRGEPVPTDATDDDGSEMSLISPAESDSKNSNDVKNSNIPVILILGTVGLLVVLLLVINRKK